MQSDFKDKFKKRSPDYKPRILVVDNDRDNLLFASCILEAMGIEHQVLDDSEKCLSLVYELSPDIILLDVVMPKVNGLEIAEVIKQDPNIAHISIIAVTGLTKDEDKKHLIEAGFDDYICKPYLIEELESKIYTSLKCLLA